MAGAGLLRSRTAGEGRQEGGRHVQISVALDERGPGPRARDRATVTAELMLERQGVGRAERSKPRLRRPGEPDTDYGVLLLDTPTDGWRWTRVPAAPASEVPALLDAACDRFEQMVPKEH